MAKKQKTKLELLTSKKGRTMAKTGEQRKTYYDKHIKPYLEDIREMVMKGYTNSEIIDLMEVSNSTFYKWRREIPEFNEIFENPEMKQRLKEELFDALYRRAKGFHVEETFENIVGGKKVSETKQTRYIFSDKAAEQYIRTVLGGPSSDHEINITFKNGEKEVKVSFGTDDDEGDYEQSI